jgi:23S rRNA (guanine2535-N1)-methyltransferase
MPYQFATDDQDYTNYASGRVFYSLPGLPAFPIRLASEIFLRALRRFPPRQRLTLYDPTCGGAYHLAALGLLNGEAIGKILASDVDERALELARRNLGLISAEGLARREHEIQTMLEKYGKESHAGALRSVEALRERAKAIPSIHTRVFQANAMDQMSLQKELSGETIDLVFSDVPYGQLSGWLPPENASTSGNPPIWQMLDALLPSLQSGAIVAIAANKAQNIAHMSYRRIERFQVGKRQIAFLTPQAYNTASR